MGTVQVDYVMPERFQLEYIGADNQKHRPVIIHRAPFGSFERFVAILIEHFAGNFPFWLAPVQIRVLPISDHHISYAQHVVDQLTAAGFRVELDDRNERISRIAESEQQKIPFALIIGDKEVESSTVAVREHRVGDHGQKTLDEVVHWFTELNQPKPVTVQL